MTDDPDTDNSGPQNEERRFAPSREFAAQANAGYDVYARAEEDEVGIWAGHARRLQWARTWSEVLEWKPPYARWFVGGELNVAVNCVDRHVAAGYGAQVAINFEGEPGDTRVVTYAHLLAEVKRLANALLDLGVRPGDSVAIYLPMIPETVVAMLACARIGAPHVVISSGLAAAAIHDRIVAAHAAVVITADGGFCAGAARAFKATVDEALSTSHTAVSAVLVVRRTGQDVVWSTERDIWWHDALAAADSEHVATPFDAEHPLFILYTSETTAKPTGIVHTSGGYLTQVSWTHSAVLDLKPDSDVYWCTADVEGITGHSYAVYGPLSNRSTIVLYEGTPDTPHQGRWWEIVAKYKVTVLYATAPAIHASMEQGEHIPGAYDLTSLRLLASTGRTMSRQTWMWYRRVIGGDRTPVVDTWMQTETGAIMISPLPGVSVAKPGSVMQPLPGIGAEVVDDSGAQVTKGDSGLLVITRPWPSMARGVQNDGARSPDKHWSRFRERGYYSTEDRARVDRDGDIWLEGRGED